MPFASCRREDRCVFLRFLLRNESSPQEGLELGPMRIDIRTSWVSAKTDVNGGDKSGKGCQKN